MTRVLLHYSLCAILYAHIIVMVRVMDAQRPMCPDILPNIWVKLQPAACKPTVHMIRGKTQPLTFTRSSCHQLQASGQDS